MRITAPMIETRGAVGPPIGGQAMRGRTLPEPTIPITMFPVSMTWRSSRCPAMSPESSIFDTPSRRDGSTPTRPNREQTARCVTDRVFESGVRARVVAGTRVLSLQHAEPGTPPGRSITNVAPHRRSPRAASAADSRRHPDPRVLGRSAGGGGDRGRRVGNLDQYNSLKARTLASTHHAQLVSLYDGIYHCLPWVDVRNSASAAQSGRGACATSRRGSSSSRRMTDASARARLRDVLAVRLLRRVALQAQATAWCCSWTEAWLGQARRLSP